MIEDLNKKKHINLYQSTQARYDERLIQTQAPTFSEDDKKKNNY